MAALLYRLGRFSARRYVVVLVTWLVALVVAGGAYLAFGGTITTAITIPGTATQKVTDDLATTFPEASGGSGTVVFATQDGAALTSEQQRDVSAVLEKVAKVDGVKAVSDPFQVEAQREKQTDQLTQGAQQVDDGKAKLAAAQDQVDAGQKQLDAAVAQAKTTGTYSQAKPQLDAQQKALDEKQSQLDEQTKKLEAQSAQVSDGQALAEAAAGVRTVSKDGSAALATVQFDQSTLDVPQSVKDDVEAAVTDNPVDGVDSLVGNDIAQTVPKILGIGEVVGLVIAAIVLFVMLGTFVGAGLPLLNAVLGVLVASAASLAFSGVVDFISVTPVLGVMLGLAVGIDYSLFILNRHRRQLKQGMDVHESIGLANGTSGNAVVFAGSTVVVALLALNITGIPFLGLMGTVAAVAVVVAILVAVTVTPAMLGLLGQRILSRKERAAAAVSDVPTPRSGTAAADAPMSTVRAVVTLVLGVLLLGVVAIPATSMRLGLPDGSSEDTGTTQYQAYKTVEAEFGAGQNGPLLVVATLPDAPADDAALLSVQVGVAQEVTAQGDVAGVAPVGTSSDRTTLVFQVIPEGGPNSESTEQLVKDLRALSPVQVDGRDVTLGVAGNASANIDVSEKLADVLPLYLAVVVGLSLLILILVFRSLLVPLTATVGFVLSVLASFGGITAIYQWGWLGSVFGVHDPAPILSFLPIIEIGILFGLAMDYQLFLVSGMREAYAHGAEPRLAVQRGFRAGRPVVTAAAIIMISVFGGFIFSDEAMIRPIGFGLAFGVLVDAFVVRMMLIPAVMHLMGGAAWWLPRWLDRLLPDVDVEGAQLERSHPVPGEPGTPADDDQVPVR
ncbi:MMPL family transporter [Luteimicrobium subarcticum]|uniref:RND superfamily putative drug exporter n=1 Tax=Luteimicrobium subarcticum TaxID=620910 RepID=A0A2M8W1J8_9MICO|nr:MMPL family transporter [Luteimicrobium subarcticum]PJI84804.1 RND superfamily putative drug exporter [Luteimicrobium subarcticum]